jgi:Flp pilus assembly protein TadD
VTPGIRLLCGFVFCVEAVVGRQAEAAAADPENDPQLPKLLEEARSLIYSKKAEAALEKCETVIARFKARYGNSKEKVYCALTSTENLGYLLMAASAMNEGKFEAGKKQAIVLSTTWSGAYFIKGYALEELGKRAEAKSAIKQALELSPWNAHYLSEFAYLYALDKDWAKAKETYQKAEEHAQIAPDNAKAEELGRARRGLGYVFVELGELDEAEKKYQQCLKDNPHDKKAAAELEYVRELKAKAKSK